MRPSFLTPMVLASLMLIATSALAQDKTGVQEDEPACASFFGYVYLDEVAKHLDCYFTVEVLNAKHDNVPGEKRPSETEDKRLEKWHRNRVMYDVPDCRNIKTVDDLIAKLSTAMKGVKFVRNAKNSKVIHVINDDVVELPGYAMNLKVDLDYPLGRIDGISEIFAERKIGIAKPWDRIPITSFKSGYSDSVTEVEVHVKNHVLRDVITDCIPLQGYSRILWVAESIEQDGRPLTLIMFRWPGS